MFTFYKIIAIQSTSFIYLKNDMSCVLICLKDAVTLVLKKLC